MCQDRQAFRTLSKGINLKRGNLYTSCQYDFMKVFVLNKHGDPLMPCDPRKAKLLLRDGKAKVLRRNPFTIQLLHGSSGYRQRLVLGVDTGHGEVGLSVISKTKEVFSAVIAMRNNISDLMTTRRTYRRNKRNRLRYREPRFLNWPLLSNGR